jgi:hypothetical protein
MLGFDYNSDRILIPGLGSSYFVFVVLHWTQQSNCEVLASKLLVHFIWPGIKNKLETDLKMWMNHILEDTCPSSRSPRCNAGIYRFITKKTHSLTVFRYAMLKIQMA